MPTLIKFSLQTFVQLSRSNCSRLTGIGGQFRLGGSVVEGVTGSVPVCMLVKLSVIGLNILTVDIGISGQWADRDEVLLKAGKKEEQIRHIINSEWYIIEHSSIIQATKEKCTVTPKYIYIHRGGRRFDQCGACSGSPQLATFCLHLRSWLAKLYHYLRSSSRVVVVMASLTNYRPLLLLYLLGGWFAHFCSSGLVTSSEQSDFSHFFQIRRGGPLASKYFLLSFNGTPHPLD